MLSPLLRLFNNVEKQSASEGSRTSRQKNAILYNDYQFLFLIFKLKKKKCWSDWCHPIPLYKHLRWKKKKKFPFISIKYQNVLLHNEFRSIFMWTVIWHLFSTMSNLTFVFYNVKFDICLLQCQIWHLFSTMSSRLPMFQQRFCLLNNFFFPQYLINWTLVKIVNY